MKSPQAQSFPAVALLVLAALAAGIGCSAGPAVTPPADTGARTQTAEKKAPNLDTEYQAIVLTNGQVLVGKLENLDSPYPVLRDVFAVRTVPAGDPKDPQKVTNVLVSRAKEWHAPSYTVLNARQILAIEPVSAGSRLSQLVAQEKKTQATP